MSKLSRGMRIFNGDSCESCLRRSGDVTISQAFVNTLLTGLNGINWDISGQIGV